MILNFTHVLFLFVYLTFSIFSLGFPCSEHSPKYGYLVVGDSSEELVSLISFDIVDGPDGFKYFNHQSLFIGKRSFPISQLYVFFSINKAFQPHKCFLLQFSVVIRNCFKILRSEILSHAFIADDATKNFSHICLIVEV